NGKAHWLAEYGNSESFSLALGKILGRPLSQYELDMGNHPRRCLKCGSYAQDKLVNCQKCYCVAFCSEHVDDGKLAHEPHCRSLRTSLDDHKFEITVGHQVQNYSPRVETKRWTPLPEGIQDFFSDDISSLVSQKLPGYRDSELRYLTFLYTCPLSVLHALEETGSKLGASSHPPPLRLGSLRFSPPSTQEPLHRLYRGRMRANGVSRSFSYKGKALQIEDRKDLTLYHDYVSASDYTEPDVVVALDCGFKFYPSWRASLPAMLRPSGAPLIFTEFNLPDTRDNLSLLKSCVPGAVVKIEPRMNSYSSKRPVRCSDSSENYVPYSVIYTNDYLCAVSL
ncbi:Putative LOC101449370, partial [Caligus rogercresseyi]